MSRRERWIKIRRDLLFYLSRRLCYPLMNPDYFMVSLTDDCNLRCEMCGCSETAQKYRGRELSAEEIKYLIDQIELWTKKAEITFSGGEPFVRHDILDLIDYVCKKNLRLSINTNGTLINRDIADRIVRLSLYHINVSLDGDSEEINDAIRGKGVFSRILDCLSYLKEAKEKYRNGNPFLSFNVTVMKENINGIANIVSLAKNYGVQNILFQPVITDNTDFQKKNRYILFNDRELETLFAAFEKIKLQAQKNHIDIYIPSFTLLREYFTARDIIRKHRKWECCIGYNRISISSFGQVYSCLGQLFGESRNTRLRKIWYSKNSRAMRKQFKKCKQFCLQTCYARPDSESFISIAKELWESINVKTG